MKKGVTFLLILAHFTAVFNFTVPYLSYLANFNYFSTEACINKNNPDLNCNGSCQLDKMIQQQHQQDKNATTHQVDRAPKVDFFFQKTVVFNQPAMPHSSLFFAEEDLMTSLWETEPASPPPKHA